ncbi:insulin-like growth factor-binding protein 3-like [Scleropages formosus]|uniref:Insulin-like growth factor-binding protein 3-like n=1 Tax=Scleropages formosus TaxID=113540 RepID=A0A0P7UM76_SCLFO|nr:insulin-like growth factor-binding protein 3-like [Scleropages formosus]
MISTLYLLCLAAVLAPSSREAEAVGPVVRCETCDAGALSQCRPLPKDCTEVVREPGCGCCLTCGSGLTCQHRPSEIKPLQALLEGRGVCSSAVSKKLSSILLPVHKQGKEGEPGVAPLGVLSRGFASVSLRLVPDVRHVPTLLGENSPTAAHRTAISAIQPQNIQDPEEDWNTNSTDFLEPESTLRVPEQRGPLPHAKGDIIRRDQSKKSQSYKMESVSGGLSAEVHNFSLESKRETEYGPCRREMESILNSLKITNVLNPKGFRIPNCDKKGFYKKKQCRPSKGRKRGYCWCVDKYGQPLPGYDGKEKGEAQCYNLESKERRHFCKAKRGFPLTKNFMKPTQL